MLLENRDAKIALRFPVNVQNSDINLNIQIPEHFKVLKPDPGSDILEFIPKRDKDPYKWTEIITVSPIIGHKVTADSYIDGMIAGMQNSADSLKIIEKSYDKQRNYQIATCILQYQVNKRDEVVIIYAASGPYDLASVQYALFLRTPRELNDTIQRLKDFIKTNIKLEGTEQIEQPS
jgi:hypothetical protein